MPAFLFQIRYIALIVFFVTVIVSDFEHFTQIAGFDVSRVPSVVQRLLAEFKENTVAPPAVKSVPVPTKNRLAQKTPQYPITGTFDSGEVHPIGVSPWNGHISKTISFTEPYPRRPSIPVALMWLDIGNSHNVRAKCSSTSIGETSFNINIDTWSGTQLYQGRCGWLELNHPDFESGIYNTEEDHSWRNPQKYNTRTVKFSHRYTEPPQVVVWLSQIDMRRDRDWRIKAFPTDVTRTGFTIHIDTWGDSELYTAAASWVAYKRDIPEVHSGIITTDTGEPEGYTRFGNGVFMAPPRIMIGISSLYISCDRSLRLSVGTKSVGGDGMTWYLKSWGDTQLYSATASYIALG